jgi:hypothetical protein
VFGTGGAWEGNAGFSFDVGLNLQVIQLVQLEQVEFGATKAVSLGNAVRRRPVARQRSRRLPPQSLRGRAAAAGWQSRLRGEAFLSCVDVVRALLAHPIKLTGKYQGGRVGRGVKRRAKRGAARAESSCHWGVSALCLSMRAMSG